MSLPLNTTYDDIYEILYDLDTDDDSNGSMIADFIERLSKEVEGKEVLAKAYKENKIEIMKLKEENEKLQEDLLMSINTDDIAEIAGEDKEYYRDVCCAYTLGKMILENKKLKEEISTLSGQYELAIQDIKQGEEENESSDEEESSDKYDGDDWGWVYGKMMVDMEDGDKEVLLVMAGGGDHWENYIMTPTMNYIVNKDGKHPQRDKVLVQSSCGKYVSFQDKDYKCEEDECICEYENCVVE